VVGKKLVNILGFGVEISGALTWPSQTRPTRQEGHLKCPFFRSVQFESFTKKCCFSSLNFMKGFLNPRKAPRNKANIRDVGKTAHVVFDYLSKSLSPNL
jgi:hypothetical protein